MHREDHSLYVVDPDEKMSDADCHAMVRDAFARAWKILESHEDNDPNQGFVISGKALSCVFPHRKHDAKGREIPPTESEAKEESEYQSDLLKCLLKCRAVLCCRVSPIQKAQMVELVKNNVLNTITLAIGDGANDVPMIKAAHVGVGISGQEGLQAVMASDYAIAQFRFLQELLLIHGAWNYRRISVMVLYYFYKNCMVSMTQIFYGFFCGMSGTMFYTEIAGSAYNFCFTGLPPLMQATFDRYYSKTLAKLCPELYASGPNDEYFHFTLFLRYFVKGVLHAVIILLCSVYLIDSTSIGTTGLFCWR